jgi:hypothetical protein
MNCRRVLKGAGLDANGEKHICSKILIKKRIFPIPHNDVSTSPPPPFMFIYCTSAQPCIPITYTSTIERHY